MSEGLLKAEPAQRLSIKAAVENPWLLEMRKRNMELEGEQWPPQVPPINSLTPAQPARFIPAGDNKRRRVDFTVWSEADEYTVRMETKRHLAKIARIRHKRNQRRLKKFQPLRRPTVD